MCNAPLVEFSVRRFAVIQHGGNIRAFVILEHSEDGFDFVYLHNNTSRYDTNTMRDTILTCAQKPAMSQLNPRLNLPRGTNN